MSLSRRSSRLAPGSALLIGLLLLMLGLSSVLAYQALDAARSEARSAERSLRSYAALAHWELSRRGGELVAERLGTAGAAIPIKKLFCRSPSPALFALFAGEGRGGGRRPLA